MNGPSLRRRALAALALFCALVALTPGARAGGPLVVSNGQPVTWARERVVGPAPLNSETVDALGRVVYHVDSGPLGPLSNEEAVALVDRIFGLYNDIPTASIEFVTAGRSAIPSRAPPSTSTTATRASS